MPSIMLGTILVEGHKYRIVWKTEAMKYFRESIMQFLCVEEYGSGIRYTFSARPVAGTQTMGKHEQDTVVLVERVADSTPCVMNRVLRGNPTTEHTA